MKITQAELKDIMHYDGETGIFTRIKKTARRQKIGEIVGVNCKNGYLKCGIKNKEYYLHTLAWLYVYGYLPEQLDHINHDRKDNRISNLRAVSDIENSKNHSMSKANTSGMTGVSFYEKENVWLAQICHSYKKMMKRFKTEDEAINQRKEWEKEFGFHENHGV